MKTEKLDWLTAATVTNTDECLIWPWATNSRGYGQIWTGHKLEYVHVLACSSAHGDRPPGMQAAHSCNVRRCANPRHLRWATPAENQADRRLHGTDGSRERHSSAKLNSYAVMWIRSLYESGAYSYSELGDMFGVGYGTIGSAVRRRTWK